jgi:L-lysine 2,3-aminomutase
LNDNIGRPKLRFFSLHHFNQIPQLAKLSPEHRWAMWVVAHVLPFRVNNYVVEELIDWDRIPDDPIFQLTFPQPGMLPPHHFERMAAALSCEASPSKERSGGPHQASAHVREVADGIRRELNPHPEGQLAYNVPHLDDAPVPGVQHKYSQTVLVFPSAGQTCHAYCSFCFRWAQFVGMPDLKLATDESMRFAEYLRRHREVTDVLFTGGDPLVMRADVLARYIEPLLAPEFAHIQTIRLGTKSLSYWPYRFLSDNDTEDLVRLLGRILGAGKHLAIMAHFNHVRELETKAVQAAICRLLSLGAVIRTQSPLVRRINDDEDVWARMWRKQVSLGCIPYYMFVERDTGAQHFFKVPLYRALEVYRGAVAQGSGLARTARGPVMSALPGKVAVEGVAEVAGQQVFVLSFLQARDPGWCKQPFFAKFDPTACWLNDLKPAFGEKQFFYEPGLSDMLAPRATSLDANLHRSLEPATAPTMLPEASREQTDGLVTTAA